MTVEFLLAYAKAWTTARYLELKDRPPLLQPNQMLAPRSPKR